MSSWIENIPRIDTEETKEEIYGYSVLIYTILYVSIVVSFCTTVNPKVEN